jgi:hypothetical protein
MIRYPGRNNLLAENILIPQTIAAGSEYGIQYGCR